MKVCRRFASSVLCFSAKFVCVRQLVDVNTCGIVIPSTREQPLRPNQQHRRLITDEGRSSWQKFKPFYILRKDVCQQIFVFEPVAVFKRFHGYGGSVSSVHFLVNFKIRFMTAVNLIGFGKYKCMQYILLRILKKITSRRTWRIF